MDATAVADSHGCGLTPRLDQERIETPSKASLPSKSPDRLTPRLDQVKQLAEYCKAPPDKISETQLRRYFLHLTNEKKFAYGSLRVTYSGIKFFYSTSSFLDEQHGVPIAALPPANSLDTVQRATTPSSDNPLTEVRESDSQEETSFDLHPQWSDSAPRSGED